MGADEHGETENRHRSWAAGRGEACHRRYAGSEEDAVPFLHPFYPHNPPPPHPSEQQQSGRAPPRPRHAARAGRPITTFRERRWHRRGQKCTKKKMREERRGSGSGMWGAQGRGVAMDVTYVGMVCDRDPFPRCTWWCGPRARGCGVEACRAMSDTGKCQQSVYHSLGLS